MRWRPEPRRSLCFECALAVLFLAGAGSEPFSATGTAAFATAPAAQSGPSQPADDPEDIRQTDIFAERVRQNQLQQVRPLLEAYLKQHPDSWRAQYQLGYILFRLHDVQGSILALSKSLQLNIRNAEAHKVLGLDLTMLGDYDRAQLELEQAAALAPESAEIHYFLGRVYYTKNIFPQARQEFEAAIKFEPTYMKAYDNLGLTLEAVGESDAAVENWRRAIELSEKQGLASEWPLTNLAAFYNRQNDPQEALAYSQKAVEKNPSAAEAYFQMGRAYRSLEKPEPAAEALQKAIANDPDNAEYHYVLSMVYRKLGKNAESQAEEAAFRRLKQKESTAGLGGVSPGRMDHRPKPTAVDRNE